MRTLPTRTVALVISSEDLPKLHVLDHAPGSEMELNGQVFRDSGLGDWQGFYDWLRISPGKIIGVNQWLDGNYEHIAPLSKCRNVSLDSHKGCLLIFLGEERHYKAELSNDQDFGENRLFRGQRAHALTFNVPEQW